jgi:hypothetical protein
VQPSVCEACRFLRFCFSSLIGPTLIYKSFLQISFPRSIINKMFSVFGVTECPVRSHMPPPIFLYHPLTDDGWGVTECPVRSHMDPPIFLYHPLTDDGWGPIRVRHPSTDRTAVLRCSGIFTTTGEDETIVNHFHGVSSSECSVGMESCTSIVVIRHRDIQD